ncbi:Serine/Threonine kinase domain protein (macronuclear) [Tetrahymena thermophila SB210]|uniref:Serine/Threonine kinase domain protein n=1 Tax=Tetrahymena thermophila (strain SB210) TaxID=312017 RepID=I7M0V3_TETTS|nr:Serine/Threonine kinase domain protein [Tetrahymena thermophila SB210]EAR91002.2 Serine/Threonine kinase domain protein [Tetrahymena thermophila SB210]|eukprot:XP_001011247.2 Serine/Threonine kinase domain protein [Tetrahymena thermophila SB210]
MLSTPKKSTYKTKMEEGYASPPSKRDTEKANKYLYSKEQYINSSNTKKNNFISHFDNTAKPHLHGTNENSKTKKTQFNFESIVKPNYGITLTQTPNVQKNLPSYEKIPQQRLFTQQINKYNTKNEFDHSTPKKQHNYKKSLFSSDSQESSTERENDNHYYSNQNKENDSHSKNKKNNRNHIFAVSEVPAQKRQNQISQLQKSARKVNPFTSNETLTNKNQVIVAPFDRENRQMNMTIHQRDNKKVSINAVNHLNNNKNANQILLPSPKEFKQLNSTHKIDHQSPHVNCFTNQIMNSANQKHQINRSNTSNSDSNNEQNNNSISSFSINSGRSCNYGNNNNSNNILNQTPSKNNNQNNSKASSQPFFEEEMDRFEQDYEVLQVLGSGFFGTVYKCQNRIDKNIYAVKVTKEQIRGENSQKQILKEAQALASLSACDEVEYIVCYHSAWIEDRQLHLAMEFCDSNLANFPLPQPPNYNQFYQMIKKIFQDVVKGLHYLHQQNLVHLDLKPENILYNKKQNKFKIADLGLALIANKDNEKYNQIEEGDARYLAKEILNYYEAVDLKKADIFSLGAMMYHLVTQEQLPTNGDEWLQIRQGHLPNLDSLNQCPKELKQMIRQMMNPDPELRLSTQEILDSSYMKSHLINEIKWQKILKNLLLISIQKLEKNQQTQQITRRKSLPILKKINFI